MSWGSEAANSGASGANAASSMPSSVGGYSTPASSGFSMTDAGANASQGPTVAAGNMQTYGTETPSILQQGGNMLERFQKGGDQSVGGAIDKFGNNAETYGYLYSKANQMAGAGKQSPASPINTTINYQQPTNPYLAKRGRY